MFKFILFVIGILSLRSVDGVKEEQIWEKDLGDTFQIDASTEGLQKVNLKCGSNSMRIELVTEENFKGVMYTRGSFYKQTDPCFVRPASIRGDKTLTMNFSFDQCQTLHEGETYSNVVVVQHDPDLVTPGDSAFAVECDFRKSRSITVGADFQARDKEAHSSRITLTSPDPSSTQSREKRDTSDSVFSETSSVTFEPSKIKEKKIKGSVQSVKLERNEKKSQDEL